MLTTPEQRVALEKLGWVLVDEETIIARGKKKISEEWVFRGELSSTTILLRSWSNHSAHGDLALIAQAAVVLGSVPQEKE